MSTIVLPPARLWTIALRKVASEFSEPVKVTVRWTPFTTSTSTWLAVTAAKVAPVPVKRAA